MDVLPIAISRLPADRNPYSTRLPYPSGPSCSKHGSCWHRASVDSDRFGAAAVVTAAGQPVVALRRRRSDGRAVAFAMAGNVGLVALALGGGLAAMFSEQVIFGLALMALALLRIAIIPSHLRVFREKCPHLVLGADGITIHDGALFAGPQFIPRARIREIVVGPGVTERFANAGVSRPWFVLLTPYLASPNAVLVLTEPAVLDQARRPFRLRRFHFVLGSAPKRSTAVEEAWLVLADPAEAFDRLQKWGPARWEEAIDPSKLWMSG